jgi:hypothetical protein
MIRSLSLGVLTTLILSVTSPASAGVIYRESVDGDLSGNHLAPSQLTLASGSNLISGTFGSTTPTSDTLDLDYVVVTVPAGLEFHRLVVTDANVGGAVAFIGMEAGTQISVPHTTASAATLLGWAHYGTTSINTDLFPEMSVASGAQGFVAPLGPGQYTLWIMELNTTDTFSYGFDVQLRPIPEPGALSVLAVPALALVRARRRR